MRRIVLLLPATALVAVAALPAAAAAQTSDTLGVHCRGIAILSPLESPDRQGLGAHCWGTFFPYYSPVIPISERWRTTHLTPYYRGYCPRRHGAGPGWGDDGVAGCNPDGFKAGDYGPYTGGPRDEAMLIHLGGAGLAPAGAAGCAPAGR